MASPSQLKWKSCTIALVINRNTAWFSNSQCFVRNTDGVNLWINVTDGTDTVQYTVYWKFEHQKHHKLKKVQVKLKLNAQHICSLVILDERVKIAYSMLVVA